MTQEQALNEIAGKVGKLEAMQEASTKAIESMASSVNRLVDKLDESDDVAKEALQSARSAHHRLNGIDKIIFWAGTTVAGAVFLALIGLLWKGGGK